MNRIALVLSSFLVVALAHAASFDCTKASTKVEHVICDTPEISKLDDELAVSYKVALKDKAQAGAVKQAQKQWLKERNDCTDAICIKSAYEARLSSLATREASQGAIPKEADKKAPRREQKEIEKLFGQYTITGYKRYGGGLTTEAEERSKIGKTVYIGKDKYVYIDKMLRNPVYRLEHIKVDFGEGNIVPRDTSIFYGIEEGRKTVDRLLVFANLSAAKDDDQWADGLEILSGGRLLDMDDGFFLFLKKTQAK